ncbi:hypothetical protein Y1Q_0007833 [Alligator mississippiensis]|uniref:Uncharacterized protein n=1 Tax=Alligator mississippiensis TaxID=8496 RepID=A0A151N769_ALLMI|nr:hypothetical protein Y1Q_0007833 [Alligator mississippiensis]
MHATETDDLVISSWLQKMLVQQGFKQLHNLKQMSNPIACLDHALRNWRARQLFLCHEDLEILGNGSQIKRETKKMSCHVAHLSQIK